MSQRKNELKKWLIDNPLSPDLIEAAAARLGVTPNTVRCYPFGPTMPPRVHEEFLLMGVPEYLLPSITRPKSEIIEENKELRRRLAKYEPEWREARA